MTYQPLSVCPGCSRHVRQADASCPFCGKSKDGATAFRMLLAGSVLAAAIAGCGGSQPEAVALYASPPPPEDETVLEGSEPSEIATDPTDTDIVAEPDTDPQPVPAYAPVPMPETD